ncbi:unnamed protein product [Ceutorhynchus assimilis]|uniref:Uncharacterized protein n=1 Tax=Ceutorhynchus assimilis TaxID=467358 RepID=A0A9P0DBW7_9CUCU|nr:unnamed protein product [Ceutorhynchus assimilis]
MDYPTSRNRERILEAIDQLRNRKARPDIARICNYLFRRFHVNSAEARADLEWCVANNIVLKVEYKGNISYRNAAKKWAQIRKREAQQTTHKGRNALSKLAISRNFMEMLTNIFGELVMQEPDYLEIGVPPTEIMTHILSKDSVRYTRNYVAILLVKEVERGNLIKLENGNFLLGPCDAKLKPKRKRAKSGSSKPLVQIDTGAGQNAVKPKKRMIAKMQAAAHQQEVKMDKQENMDSGDEGKRSESEGQRSGRRKKAKKVFDPSDIQIPKKRGRPGTPSTRNTFNKKPKADEDSRADSLSSAGSSKDQGGVCSVCHTQSKRGPHDRMVGCRECSNKAHYECLNSDDMMQKLNPNNSWTCPHCKTCVTCFETSKARNLIVCAVCADAYHATCHQPEITEKLEKGQKWLCNNCQATEEMRPDAVQANIGESFNFKITNTKENVKDTDVSPGLQLKIRPKSFLPNNNPPNIPLPPVLSSHPKSKSPKRKSKSPKREPKSPKREPKSPKKEPQSDSISDKDSDNENANSDRHSESGSPEIPIRNPGPEIDPSIPDARNWTPHDLYQYFRQFLKEDEAKVFKEQDIDGRSFLLMRRIDVLTKLNLRLGPALKVYRHLTMLQVRRDDRSLYWL